MDELHTVVLSVAYRHAADGDDQMLGWLIPTLERGAGVESVTYLDPRPVDELHTQLVYLVHRQPVEPSIQPVPTEPAAEPLRALLLEAFRCGAKAMHLGLSDGHLEPVDASRHTDGLVLNQDEVVDLARFAADFTYATCRRDLVVPARSLGAPDRWQPASHLVFRSAGGELKSYPWEVISSFIWRLATAVRSQDDSQ